MKETRKEETDERVERKTGKKMERGSSRVRGATENKKSRNGEEKIDRKRLGEKRTGRQRKSAESK